MVIERLRSNKYMLYIRSKPCLICGGAMGKSDAHHITFAQPRAKGKKNGDQWTVPVCRIHHTELHNFAGGERSFWAIHGIVPMVWAENEYQQWKEQRDGS